MDVPREFRGNNIYLMTGLRGTVGRARPSPRLARRAALLGHVLGTWERHAHANSGVGMPSAVVETVPEAVDTTRPFDPCAMGRLTRRAGIARNGQETHARGGSGNPPRKVAM